MIEDLYYRDTTEAFRRYFVILIRSSERFEEKVDAIRSELGIKKKKPTAKQAIGLQKLPELQKLFDEFFIPRSKGNNECISRYILYGITQKTYYIHDYTDVEAENKVKYAMSKPSIAVIINYDFTQEDDWQELEREVKKKMKKLQKYHNLTKTYIDIDRYLESLRLRNQGFSGKQINEQLSRPYAAYTDVNRGINTLKKLLKNI